MATRGALELLSRPGFSRAIGRVAQGKAPRALLRRAIRMYIDHYGVNVAEMEHPVEHYETFDAFFTRRLEDGVHTIDPDPGTAVCPVDGAVMSVGRVADGRIDQVKGRSYLLAELLDSEVHAERFQDGHYVTLYLSPRDYHRIHCPVDGLITGFRYVPGRLYPVNDTGVTHIDRLFAVNERMISFVESDLGEVAVVKVGATNVGMITLSYSDVRTNEGRRTAWDQALKRKTPIGRGEELGMFHLGSTVVVVSSRPDLVPVPLERDQKVRMGEPLLKARSARGPLDPE